MNGTEAHYNLVMMGGVYTTGEASFTDVNTHSPMERCPNIINTWAPILEAGPMSQKRWVTRILKPPLLLAAKPKFRVWKTDTTKTKV